MSDACRRSVAGAMLAVFFALAAPMIPVHAALTPDWKAGIVQIEGIRDEAVLALFELVAEFEASLSDGPSAAEAAQLRAGIRAEMEEVAGGAIAEIGSVVADFPRDPQIEQAGSRAAASVVSAQSSASAAVTMSYDDYVGALSPPEPVTTTTTTASVTTTTTRVTTTTLPTTTTTVPSISSTTSSTTTTLAVLSAPSLTPPTTTTTAPVSTTTTMVPASSSADSVAGLNPQASLGVDDEPVDVLPLSTRAGGVGEAAWQGSRSDENLESRLVGEIGPFSDASRDHSGITASLTRVLEPILPAQVADVVVSPLLIIEVLWRAISSSGRGLVMPISLLSFSVISLIWDRRRLAGGSTVAEPAMR